MKRVIGILVIAVSVLVMSFTIQGNNDVASVEAENMITWLGKKVTGEHTGNINFKSTDLQMMDGELVKARFVVDMTTITCTDLGEEYAKKLVGHLNSDDFFNTAEFNESSFIATKIVNNGDNNYTLSGDLTIKGKTNDLTFDATVVETNGMVTANADVVVDRAKYDIKYGSGSFFDGLGDNLIYDDFELSISIKKKL